MCGSGGVLDFCLEYHLINGYVLTSYPSLRRNSTPTRLLPHAYYRHRIAAILSSSAIFISASSLAYCAHHPPPMTTIVFQAIVYSVNFCCVKPINSPSRVSGHLLSFPHMAHILQQCEFCSPLAGIHASPLARRVPAVPPSSKTQVCGSKLQLQLLGVLLIGAFQDLFHFFHISHFSYSSVC